MKIHFYTFFFVFCLSITNVWSQTLDNDATPEDIYRYFASLLLEKNQHEQETILFTFKQHQRSKKFEIQHYKGIVQLVNQLEEYQLKPADLTNILAIWNVFADDQSLTTTYFQAWLDCLTRLLEQEPAPKGVKLMKYLAWSRNFWEKGVLTLKQKHQWQASKKNFVLGWDDNQPVIFFTNTNLYCTHLKDSLVVENTNGTYYPLREFWKGKKGQINWAGSIGTYIQFSNYEIDTKQSAYQITNAVLHSNELVQTTINGVLVNKLERAGVANRRYPRFIAYEILPLSNLMNQQTIFYGRLKLEGESVSVVEGEESLVTLLIKDNKRLEFKAVAKHFSIINKERIRSTDASISLYLHGATGRLDSIIHPSIELFYYAGHEKLHLKRSKGNGEQHAFYNSLQAMEMDVASLTWWMNSKEISFGDNNQNLFMHSKYFFSEHLVEAYQSIGNTNPLSQIGRYAVKLSENLAIRTATTKPWQQWIGIDTIALLLDKKMEQVLLMSTSEIEKLRTKQHFKVIEKQHDFKVFADGFPKVFKFAAMDVADLSTVLPSSTLKGNSSLPLYTRMAKDGFLEYNKQRRAIRLKRKLFHYLKAMNQRQKNYDYDKIKIRSLPTRNSGQAANAILNLEEGVIDVYGVQYIKLSEKQRVFIRPYGSIQMLEDCNIAFNGQLTGGYCHFTGSNFEFLYESYQVDLKEINFIDFFINQPANNGLEERVAVESVLEGTEGLLLIDAPNNKAGKKETAAIYPSFESTKTAYVYYNKNNQQGNNQYPKQDFYYEVKPFILNGIDSLTNQQLVFDGQLKSASIFEPIHASLRLMEHDLSLGFETTTRGKQANPLYIAEQKQGKGRFKGTIGLSNAGLLGSGRIHYLVASMETNHAVFLPKQCFADEVHNVMFTASEHYPVVFGARASMHWFPYQDSMKLSSQLSMEMPFQLFDSTSFTLEGTLLLQPQSLSGTGTFNWEGATIESNEGGAYQFGQHSIASKNAAVIIKSTGNHQFAFENDQVDFKINFEQQKGVFKVLGEKFSTNLIYHSYSTTLDQFHWNMATNHVTMNVSEGQKGLFVATAKDQDSLSFYGSTADYDLNGGKLVVSGVEGIQVADALIVPDSQCLVIKKAANIEQLENATLIIGQQVFKAANVIINNKNEYTASGELAFPIDSDVNQVIPFTQIEVVTIDSLQCTKGHATLTEKDQFYLNPQVQFKGNVSIKACEGRLFFDGWAKIQSNIITTTEWFKVSAYIDAKNAIIPYD